MNRAICLTIVLVGLAGCDKQTGEPAATNGAETSGAAADTTGNAATAPSAGTAGANTAGEGPAGEPPFVLQVGTFDAGAIPEGLEVTGAVVDGVRFTDANGEHVVVLSQVEESKDMHAVFAALDDSGNPKVLRKVRQLRGDCEWDYSANFVDGALAATDVDKDGIGEVTIAYKVNCASDVSPSEYKVLILEGEEKSVLRGVEILMVEGEDIPFGNGKFEAEGFEQKPALMKHAERVWKRNLVRQF